MSEGRKLLRPRVGAFPLPFRVCRDAGRVLVGIFGIHLSSCPQYRTTQNARSVIVVFKVECTNGSWRRVRVVSCIIRTSLTALQFGLAASQPAIPPPQTFWETATQGKPIVLRHQMKDLDSDQSLCSSSLPGAVPSRPSGSSPPPFGSHPPHPRLRHTQSHRSVYLPSWRPYTFNVSGELKR